MTRIAHPLELLAPAKNLEFGIEAIRHGADAVYIGGPTFGARAAAGNSVADIEQLCGFAHRFGAHVYVAFNTLLQDEELTASPNGSCSGSVQRSRRNVMRSRWRGRP